MVHIITKRWLQYRQSISMQILME